MIQIDMYTKKFQLHSNT